MKNPDIVMAGLVGLLLGSALVMVPAKAVITGLRSEAVKHGAAEWVVDPSSGNTDFQWKEVKP